MNGLAARVNRDGRPVERRVIQSMLDAVSYLGRDGSSIWADGSTALGQATTIMLSEDVGTSVPFVSRRSGSVIIADVRLDDRENLCSQLGDRRLSQASDTEIVMAAYEAWGLDAPTHLIGDFAFVIWDPRQQRLFCVRDTGGQRTLYYRLDGHAFAAASEIHQLLTDPSVPIEPDDETILDSLDPLFRSIGERENGRTYYRGIAVLSAGHVLELTLDRLTIRRYWDPRPDELHYRDSSQYVDQYRELFFGAVKARLRTMHPVSVMLSGGLDSAAITCAAQSAIHSGELSTTAFSTYTLTFTWPECDERELVLDQQRMYGFSAIAVECEKALARLRLDPSGFFESPSTIVSEKSLLYASALRDGVRVLLNGDVADYALGTSHLYFDSLLRQGYYRECIKQIRRYWVGSDESLHKILALYVLAPLLPIGLQRRLMIAHYARAFRQDRRSRVPHWIPSALGGRLNQRFIDRVLDRERQRRFSSPARQNDYDLLFPWMTLRPEAGWPIEVSCPYADRRLLEFLLAVPPFEKLQIDLTADHFYAGSKLLTRRALEGVLPASIRTRRSKGAFLPLLRSEIVDLWPVYVEAFGPAGRSRVAERGYIDQLAFWERLKRLRAASDDAGYDMEYGKDFGWIRHIFGLETWLRSLEQPRHRLRPSQADDLMVSSGTVLSASGGEP